MKEYLDLIDERFPIRNSKEEKAVFRAWALGEAAGRAEENEGHVNLVFGDPDSDDEEDYYEQ